MPEYIVGGMRGVYAAVIGLQNVIRDHSLGWRVFGDGGEGSQGEQFPIHDQNDVEVGRLYQNGSSRLVVHDHIGQVRCEMIIELSREAGFAVAEELKRTEKR